VGNFTNFINTLTFGGLAFIIALYYQLVKGFTPTQAGLALIPLDITLLFAGPLSGKLSDRYGARWLSSIGLAVGGVAFLVFSTLDLNTSELTVIGALALAGLGTGLFKSPNASSVMASVPAESRGVAAAIRSTVINSSVAMSIPLVTLVMTFVIPYGVLSDITKAHVATSANLALFVASLKLAFLTLAALNFAAAALSPLRGKERRVSLPVREE